MAERAYTVSEIDSLRDACEMRYLYGTTTLHGDFMVSRTYDERDKAISVEEMVRTYMTAGITANDIRVADEGRTQSGNQHHASG